jgi:cobalamin biosynthetic protein CobC
VSGKVEHGGALDLAIARHGGAPGDWLDLSTGINPWAWPWPARRPAVPAQCLARLPLAADLGRLIAAARIAYRVPDRFGIVAAPGAQALIDALARFLPGKTASVLAGENGTYSEYARRSAASGRRVRTAASVDDLAVRERLVWVCRPNNPDGVSLPPETLIALCGRQANGFVVIDESFADAGGGLAPARLPANAVLLRSFGKFYGLAGLRLGFAILARPLDAALADAIGPWAVSGPAIEIGAAALADRKWRGDMRARLRARSDALARRIARSGLKVAGCNPLFVLARHPRAADLALALADRHILVRSFSDRPQLLRFGLPPSEAAQSRLARALRDAQRAVR